MPMHRHNEKFRLAILAQHVIQYHSPIYRELSQSEVIDPLVLFLDRMGSESVYDATMGAHIQWDIPLLDGFKYLFLDNWSPNRHKAFLNRINPGIFRHLTRGRFDGVLVQGYTSISSIFGVIAARLAGLRLIFRGEAVLSSAPSTAWKEKAKTLLVSYFLRNSDAVLYSCRGNREMFRHYGCPDEKLFPFPCAVDNAYFRGRRAELQRCGGTLKGTLGISDGVPVVLMVGRFNHVKRQEDLVRSAAALQENGVDHAVVFVGDGPKLDEVRRLAQSLRLRNVHFEGFKNMSQIPMYYEMADMLCLCSSLDPSPKVINEALNFELPIISSDRPGTIGDSILHNENALVFPCGDVGSLAKNLERLIRSPDIRKRFGRRSLELADALTLEADVHGLECAIKGRA